MIDLSDNSTSDAADPVFSRSATRASDDLYLQVREILLAGDVTGRGLSSRSLAERFGVNRGRIRQVLQQLELEGLVEKRPQSGTYPREVPIESLRHLFDVRMAIEPRAAWLAAPRIAPADVAELQRCSAQLAACGVAAMAIQADTDGAALRRNVALLRDVMQSEVEFHRRILQVAGNPYFLKIYEDMHILAQLFQRNMKRPPGQFATTLQRSAREHESITAALADHDSDGARDAMTAHLSIGLRVLQEEAHFVVP